RTPCASCHPCRQPVRRFTRGARLRLRRDAQAGWTSHHNVYPRDPRNEGVRYVTRRLGIMMHGVTGRMGTNQHLIRSVLAIRSAGGVRLSDGSRVMPDPILIGRNAEKLGALARQYGVERWSTDLDKALDSRDDEVFFDAGTTQMRPDLLARAIARGKH